MKTIYQWRVRIYLVKLVILALWLPGCAQVEQVGSALKENVGTMMNGGNFPATDSADSCNSQVLALKTDYEYFQQPLVAKAATFRINEAITTLIQGGGTSRIMDSAVRGFTTDLVSASLQQATKNYLGSVGSETDGNYGNISQRISLDASSDSGRLASVQSKIASLESCRTQQIETVTRDYRRKNITAQDARQQAEQIQEWVRRDNRIVEEMVGQSGERVDVYVEADQYVAEQQQTRSTTKSSRNSSRSTKPKPSQNVAKAKENQQKAKEEQQKIAKLDQTIEQIKTEDFA